MAKVRSVYSFFIEKASESDENDLTNLKMQKLLFYAQAERIQRENLSLFEEPIEAWQWGPVVYSAYKELKPCGAYPISDFDLETDSSELSEDEIALLEFVWAEYGKFSPWYLMTMTHRDRTSWSDSYEEGKRNIIPVELIREEPLIGQW